MSGTTSNAYIATDGTTVMKVGKANDVKRRERQIAVPMTLTVACINEESAFRVETRLRDFLKEQGGIRHQGTVDWFRFDARIYDLLCEFVKTLFQEFQELNPSQELDIDQEIAMLVRRYHELIMTELRVQLANRNREIERLQQEKLADKEEKASLHERIVEASREAERWKTRYEDLKATLDKNNDK
jgi:hypothetical protein